LMRSPMMVNGRSGLMMTSLFLKVSLVSICASS
jgi:hypothetical protein